MATNGYVVCQNCQRLTVPLDQWARTGECPDCGGSEEERRVVNPDWPSGDEPHVELTGEPCPTCT